MKYLHLLTFTVLASCSKTVPPVTPSPKPKKVELGLVANKRNEVALKAEVVSSSAKRVEQSLDNVGNVAESAKVTAIEIYNKGAIAKEGRAIKIVDDVDNVISELNRAKGENSVVVKVSEEMKSSLEEARVSLEKAMQDLGAYEEAYKNQSHSLSLVSKQVTSLKEEVIELEKAKAKEEEWAKLSKRALWAMLIFAVLFVVWSIFKVKIKMAAVAARAYVGKYTTFFG